MTTIGRDYFPLIAEGHTPAVSPDNTIDLTPEFIVPTSDLKGAVFIAPAVGVPYSIDFTFGGTYAVGDQITIQISNGDRSVQRWTKAYRHVVQSGATSLAAIVAAFEAKILVDADRDAPYTVSSASPVLTVTNKNDDSAGISATVYTDSSAGTIAAAAASGTISEGQPQDLIDRGVDESLITLTSYDTVRIVYEPLVPIGSIDAKTPRAREIYWYGTPGTGGPLATLINAL